MGAIVKGALKVIGGGAAVGGTIYGLEKLFK
ncbi:GatB family leaderless bacteriocin [Bacillus vallismortis]|nr:GatB family leaderless bacteriocin [Bacillus vallismortis]MCY8544938.1 GatB family leaderless bacteriocin [Bacillus vallismortis]